MFDLLLLLLGASFQAISPLAIASSITFTEPSNLTVTPFTISSTTSFSLPCLTPSF
ncbi:hypothetical protein AMTRI_Chr07g79950 [Amborella trichopoda]